MDVTFLWIHLWLKPYGEKSHCHIHWVYFGLILWNMMTRWRMVVEEQRIITPDKKITGLQSYLVASLKFGDILKNFGG